MSLHLLLVNDDGIDSPMLARLCRTLAARGHRVTVAAPKEQQSAKSHCMTIFDPIKVYPMEMEGAAAAWAVAGTPVDCTRLGLLELAEKPVDLVISGINDGLNAGTAVYVSGTVGAAREAAFMTGKAMAVSLMMNAPDETLNFFCEWIATAAEKLVSWPAPPMSVLNINMPNCPVREIKPPVFCPISLVPYRDHYERRESPRGGDYFWLSLMDEAAPPEPESDIAQLFAGHITCTFLTPDAGAQAQWNGFLEEL